MSLRKELRIPVPRIETGRRLAGGMYIGFEMGVIYSLIFEDDGMKGEDMGR